MTADHLPPWSQVVHLHPDVEAGDTAVATYAIDLGALVAGDPNVPRVYRQAADFFAATHLTSGLRRLLSDVLRGLTGGKGDRVLQLRSPFGGGKSHTLAALYHAARDGSVIEQAHDLPLPVPATVRVAVFDGEKFDVQGRQMSCRHVRTMWGLLAAQLDCYDLVSYHDQNRVSPGGDVIAEMLGTKPTLLLLDEVLQYLDQVLAEPVGDTTLGRLTQNFLQALSVEVARSSNAVMVYSLQASAHEAYGNVALLRMLDHLTSRVDAKREPVTGDEILAVLRRRLLAEPPDARIAGAVADALAAETTRMRAAHAVDDSARRAAEDDRLALRDRIADAYPFHPALIDIMRERWASLPDFQRTRGALRFLSVCLHTLKREGQAGILLGPGDIPIEDGDVAHAFFTEVGQREPFKAVLQRDFVGPNARVRQIDERLAQEHPRFSGVCPAMRIATAILAYSFGGLLQPGDEDGEPVASGVTEGELLSSIVSPQVDSITAQAVLKELTQRCLFLHYDGARYAFKTTPNVTQVLEDQAQYIKPREIEAAIEDDLKSRLAGRTNAVLWPRSSDGVPHQEPRFLLAYLPLEFALETDVAQEEWAYEMLTQYGQQPRRYRNGLGLAIPERGQVDGLRQSVKYIEAAKRVRGKRKSLNLTTAQVQQLKDREDTEKAAYESAIRNLYQSVWLPVPGQGGVEIEKISLAGRPLSSHGIHERLTELLTEIPPPRLFTTVTADKIVELMRLGVGTETVRAVGVDQVVDTFYRVPGFPRLANEAVLRRAIAEGVKAGVIGYASQSGQPEIKKLAETAGYLVSPGVARIGVTLSESEIDLRAGFLVAPEAIQPVSPQEPPSGIPPSIPQVQPSADTPTTPEPQPEPESTRQTTVRMSMRMTRQQIYASVNAIANLADKAGAIKVNVEAFHPDGFDPAWLRNAVEEPLDEADVEWEN